MAYSSFKIREIVERAVSHEWSVPEFQRGFVWKATQVRDLAESLWLIETATTSQAALSAMLANIRAIEPIGKEDFLRDYGDTRFGRLLLYALTFESGATDWNSNGDRIAFQGADLVRGYEPQFHHIFPRNFLEGQAKPEEIEALANIAIIGAETNIRISNKDPLSYFSKYKIDETKRMQQFIEGEVEAMTPENFPQWLDNRASHLAVAANKFLAKLQGNS